MNITIRRYIKRISATNLIFPGIIFLVVGALLFLFPFSQVFQPPKASSVQEIMTLYENGNEYVDFSLSNLHYTTYDYFTGREDRVACYYYILDEENGPSCAFFLIPIEKTSDRAEVLENYSGKARLIAGDNRFHDFLTGFSKDIGWNTEDLTAISGNFVTSPFDYRPALILIVAGLLMAIALVCLCYMIANVLFMIFPHLHPSCKRLRRFGLDGKDFTEFDRELAQNLLIHAGQIYVTENYLIVLGKRMLWMVPLFNIVWAYKFSKWRPFVKKNKLSYSLTVITSPKDKIVIPGNKKADADRILLFLSQNFSHISVGYTEEIREKMDELL